MWERISFICKFCFNSRDWFVIIRAREVRLIYLDGNHDVLAIRAPYAYTRFIGINYLFMTWYILFAKNHKILFESTHILPFSMRIDVLYVNKLCFYCVEVGVIFGSNLEPPQGKYRLLNCLWTLVYMRLKLELYLNLSFQSLINKISQNIPLDA